MDIFKDDWLKNKYFLALAAIALGLLVAIGLLVYQNNQLQKTLSQVSQEKERVSEEKIRLSRGYPGPLITFKEGPWVHFRGSEILVITGKEDWTIDEHSCPKIFKNRDKYDALTVELMDDKAHDKKFLVLELSVPGWGVYQVAEGCVFDVEEKRLVYEMPNLGAWPFSYTRIVEDGSVLELSFPYVWFWSACTSCHSRVLEFVSYDPEKGRFVPVNHKFEGEFEELLAEYDRVAEEECIFEGKIMPVDEIQKIAGDEARCFDTTTGSPDYESLITVGEFNQIRENIRQVIRGEEASLLEDSSE